MDTPLDPGNTRRRIIAEGEPPFPQMCMGMWKSLPCYITPHKAFFLSLPKCSLWDPWPGFEAQIYHYSLIDLRQGSPLSGPPSLIWR